MMVAPERAVQLGGQELRRIIYTEEQISGRVDALGEEISTAYSAKDDLLVLGLLKGSFVFLADLVRRIYCPLQVDFLVASSYGAGQASSGHVRLLYDGEAKLTDRAVVVVEDIVDSGTTVNWLFPLLEERGPKSLELCALLCKQHAELDR
jgi:hypoxanthine phosphoribosyltransferase